MRPTIATTALLILASGYSHAQKPPSNPPTTCWREIGVRVEFGSTEQVVALKKAAQNTTCEFIGLSWRTRAMPARRSFLLWDVAERQLARVHVEPPGALGGVRWERWAG